MLNDSVNDSVVVSGLGPVSSIGIGRDAFRRGIEEGRVGTGPIRSFDTTGFPYVDAGEVVDFDPCAILTALDESEWGRSSLLAASAARLAFEDAGGPAELDPERCSSVIGTTSGESQEFEVLVAAWVDDPQAPMDSADASRVAPSSLADAVNAELGFGGEAMTVSTACSASNYAVGYAYDLLMSGEADAVIAGGDLAGIQALRPDAAGARLPRGASEDRARRSGQRRPVRCRYDDDVVSIPYFKAGAHRFWGQDRLDAFLQHLGTADDGAPDGDDARTDTARGRR